MTISAPAVLAGSDLSACDREPIHVPGSIQPHGFLLAADEAGGRLRHVSANVAELLGVEPAAALGRTWADVIGASSSALLRRASDDPLFARRAVFFDQITRTVANVTRTFVLLGHRHAGNIIVEGEVLPELTSLRDTHYQLENFLTQMEAAPDAAGLLRMAAREVRRITGFDRVMVYQFDPTWNGIVIAEDRNDVLPSYLDLRFPASDIPKQARELYRINRLRLIARSSYDAVPLLAARQPAPPLDLTLSTLRSVSPVHLEYMRNMGTGSSMSISLMRGGQLWGLISCHSREPRTVSFEVRSTCDLLGQVLSLQVAARENSAALNYRMELRSLLATLMSTMARHERFSAGLMADPKGLLQLTAATGVAVVGEGEIRLHGRTPTKAQVEGLARWLAERPKEDVFVTEALPEVLPEAQEFAWSASGVLAISISRVHRAWSSGSGRR